MNGEVFNNLIKLQKIELKSNICIDEKGTTKERNKIEELQQKLNYKCGFDETDESSTVLIIVAVTCASILTLIIIVSCLHWQLCCKRPLPVFKITQVVPIPDNSMLTAECA
jgi:hypothetical protein